jgi:radical SAM protein with 4Fe4S-binding SPASM domain
MPPLRHLTRLARVYKSYLSRDLECSHFPSKIWLEPTDVCNLRCVMCPQSMPKPFTKGYMEWELFTKIVDEAGHFVYDLNLCHRGESTIHPRIVDMVRYVKERGIHIRLHTNGAFLHEEMSAALIDAGVDVISFSFDGYTPEAYEKIRVFAKFEQTTRNIVRLLELKKARAARTPYVILETIDFSIGKASAEARAHEQAFRARFEGLPLDRFVVKRPHNWAGTYAEGDPAAAGQAHSYSPCTFPWYALVIFWDGTVSPCPQDWYGDLALGNLRDRSIADVWNGPKMRELRRKMREKAVDDLSPCNQCDMLWRPTLLGVPTTHMKAFLKENVLGYTQ